MNLLCGKITNECDYLTPEFGEICNFVIKEPIRFHRKQWEIVYILQMLKLKNLFGNGKKGITFGSGQGTDIKVLASCGCTIVATDLDMSTAAKAGWVDTNQHSHSKRVFYDPKYGPETYLNNITLDNNVNMNAIPLKYSCGEFDFATSCCSLEHLGSLMQGLQFIINSIQCVRVGGVVIHTTEFNLDSLKPDYNGETIETPITCVYRKSDFEWLKCRIEELGHRMYDIDYSVGNGLYDQYIDLPPYPGNDTAKHLRLELQHKLQKIPATCIGIVIERLH